jgi:hypothetical protein
MATVTVPILGSAQATTNGDNNANPLTLVYRDSAGGIQGNVIIGTELETSGTFAGTVVTKTATFTAGAATDYLVDCTSAAATVSFPAASANAGVIYNIIKKDSTTNAVTLSGVSGTTSLATQYTKARVFSDGTNWYSV